MSKPDFRSVFAVFFYLQAGKSVYHDQKHVPRESIVVL